MFEWLNNYWVIAGVVAVVGLGVMYWSLYVIVKWLEDTFGRGDR